MFHSSKHVNGRYVLYICITYNIYSVQHAQLGPVVSVGCRFNAASAKPPLVYIHTYYTCIRRSLTVSVLRSVCITVVSVPHVRVFCVPSSPDFSTTRRFATHPVSRVEYSGCYYQRSTGYSAGDDAMHNNTCITPDIIPGTS